MGERVGQIVKVPEVKQSSSNSRVRRTEHLRSLDTPVDRILFLQRSAGNQAVSRLMKSGALQAKLRIGQPGDVYEQEADRVAEQVMRMPEPGVQRQVEPEEEEEEMLQAKATSGHLSEVTPNLESHIHSLKGGGQPLPESDRAFFEPRFGRDFSQVRVHTDAESARAVNAKAYTLGRDVVFGEGQYALGTSEERKLLAHELTHVLQQENKGGRIQRQETIAHECREGEGPPAIEPNPEGKAPHPLIYRGKTRKRSRRPSVGDAQQLLNRFLSQLKTGDFICEAGADMEEIQRIRKKLNQHPLEVDCRFGPNTYLATVMFQRCVFPKDPPEWDGKIGPKTWPQLDKLRTTPPPPVHPPPPTGKVPPRTTPPQVKHPPARTLPTGAFLDLQIACVTDGGGCSNTATIPNYDTRCRIETGYRGLALVEDDLVCSTPGMGIAQSLVRAYPNWRSDLPNCPCTSNDAATAPDFSRDLNPFLSRFHPGADVCYRSAPVASTAGTEHRQQCCYTRGGMLLTQGSGAGTPDVWSSFFRHQRIDVQPFNEFKKDYRIYNRFWVPNQGSGCAASDPCINRCEEVFDSCRAGLRCLAERSRCLSNCRP